MQIFPLTCILIAMTVAAICQIILAKTLTAGPPSAVAEAEVMVKSQSSVVVAVTPAALCRRTVAWRGPLLPAVVSEDVAATAHARVRDLTKVRVQDENAAVVRSDASREGLLTEPCNRVVRTHRLTNSKRSQSGVNLFAYT